MKGKWVNLSSTEENTIQEEEEEEEEEEALSLCDLPINEENHSRKEAARGIETQEDFNFGSWGGGSLLTESEMCAADEVFFQGQILPFRHSVSSESGLARFRNDSMNPSRCISRSESMDHFHSSGGFTSQSSRSSSISSGSSATTPLITAKKAFKPRVLNQFHSHPSPTPQIRVSSIRHVNVRNHNPKSTIWSFFQVGLFRTPEIALQDLKVRSKNQNKNVFGSRNSNCSTSSSISDEKNNRTNNIAGGKKKKQRFFDKNGALFGGCKCSANAVEIVPSRIVMSEVNAAKEDKEQTVKKKKTTTQHNKGKQAMSRYRTFEWLKELSLEGSSIEA